MSTVQSPPATSPAVSTSTVATNPVTLARVIRSEWIKLRSVRSSKVTLFATGLAVCAMGILVSLLSDGVAMSVDDAVIHDPAGNSLFGTMIAQLVLGVFGALVITSEYSTGLIRARGVGGVRDSFGRRSSQPASKYLGAATTDPRGARRRRTSPSDRGAVADFT